MPRFPISKRLSTIVGSMLEIFDCGRVILVPVAYKPSSIAMISRIVKGTHSVVERKPPNQSWGMARVFVPSNLSHRFLRARPSTLRVHGVAPVALKPGFANNHRPRHEPVRPMTPQASDWFAAHRDRTGAALVLAAGPCMMDAHAARQCMRGVLEVDGRGKRRSLASWQICEAYNHHPSNQRLGVLNAVIEEA
jgi:hypothetical protein